MLILKKLDDMDEMKVAKDIRIDTGYEEKLQRGGFTLTLGKCKATVAMLRELLGLIRAAKVVDKQFSSQGLAMSSQARLNMIERWTALEEAFKLDPGAAAAVAWSWCLHRCLILSNVVIDSETSARKAGEVCFGQSRHRTFARTSPQTHSKRSSSWLPAMVFIICSGCVTKSGFPLRKLVLISRC